MSMRLAWLGVGGIGGVAGGWLLRAGHDVTLIDQWPANVERIKSDGLTVTALEEEFTVQANAMHLSEVATVRPQFDAVMLSVKSFDTGWASMFIEPYLAPGGFILSAQNSINEDTIAGVVGWPRVVGCVVTIGAAMYDPGHALRTSPIERPSFKVGEPSGMITPRVEAMVEILSEVGQTTTTTNLWGERWAKLATNSMGNAVAGFTGLSTAGLRETPEVRALSIRIAAELIQVAQAWGVSVEPIGGIPPQMYLEAVDDGAKKEEVESMMLDGLKFAGTGRPSLAQDVAKGRKTEVDHLNGYVVRKGAQVGVPTPINQAVMDLTHRVEAGELEPSMSNLEQVQF